MNCYFAIQKKILQVLLNLLSNAIKYSDTGTITVRSYTEDAYYFIEVIDEGCGLKKEEIDKIFDRFIVWMMRVLGKTEVQDLAYLS